MAGLPPTTGALKDGTPCLLRGAKVSDVVALPELAEENAREYEFTAHAPDEMDRALESRRQKLFEYLEKPDWVRVVASCGGRPVGARDLGGSAVARAGHWKSSNQRIARLGGPNPPDREGKSFGMSNAPGRDRALPVARICRGGPQDEGIQARRRPLCRQTDDGTVREAGADSHDARMHQHSGFFFENKDVTGTMDAQDARKKS